MPERPSKPRPRTRAEAVAVAIKQALAEKDATIATVTLERDEALANADEYLTALQRERAEFQNYKRRTNEERERDLGLAGEGLIRKVLVIADDFDRAIEARPDRFADDPWFEGIAAIDRKLRLFLESEGVTAIEAEPGTPFDPREHEAIAHVPGSDRAADEIVETYQRGYRLRDRVIRPALVAVAAGDPAEVAATADFEPTNDDAGDDRND